LGFDSKYTGSNGCYLSLYISMTWSKDRSSGLGLAIHSIKYADSEIVQLYSRTLYIRPYFAIKVVRAQYSLKFNCLSVLIELRYLDI
jgi:hypothetical protein